MDARLRFVARLLEGEAMTHVCREFGVSRKTGYKIFERYKDHGLEALVGPVAAADPLRQPVGAADRATDRRLQAREASLGRSQGPRTAGWAVGSATPHPGQEHIIHAVLHRHGLVKPPGRPRHRATGTPLSAAQTPKWALVRPFQRRVQAGRLALTCHPLTVTDYASRYLLLCEALELTREDLAITAFEQLFQERGLPEAIRSDNGVPFASPNALCSTSPNSLSGG